MPNASKGRGDRAEREAAALLSLLLGLPIRRRLGAGRADDEGDLDGLSDFVLQVADWKDVARAARDKPAGAERQRLNAQARHAATLVRFRGGCWRVVLTPEQWARLVLELRASDLPTAGPLSAADRTSEPGTDRRWRSGPGTDPCLDGPPAAAVEGRGDPCVGDIHRGGGERLAA